MTKHGSPRFPSAPALSDDQKHGARVLLALLLSILLSLEQLHMAQCVLSFICLLLVCANVVDFCIQNFC